MKVDYQLFQETYTAINYRFVDKTKDFGNIALPSYNLIDLFINHQILNGKVIFSGNITNVFNENFQEIAGFTARGRNYNLGLKINL